MCRALFLSAFNAGCITASEPLFYGNPRTLMLRGFRQVCRRDQRFRIPLDHAWMAAPLRRLEALYEVSGRQHEVYRIELLRGLRVARLGLTQSMKSAARIKPARARLLRHPAVAYLHSVDGITPGAR